MYIVLDSMYETTSISAGLYPNLDLWNANKLHYITLHYITLHCMMTVVILKHQSFEGLRQYHKITVN